MIMSGYRGIVPGFEPDIASHLLAILSPKLTVETIPGEQSERE